MVVAYVITAIGIPVYFHYCGGELEKINYVMKSDSCCGGEEDDSMADDTGCCKDENFVLKSNADFTFKQFTDHDLLKTVGQLFHIYTFSAPLIENYFFTERSTFIKTPPIRLQNDLIVSTSVIRI